jgi:hypothetical protein
VVAGPFLGQHGSASLIAASCRMARKSRRVARNRKLGDAAANISLGNPEELSAAI